MWDLWNKSKYCDCFFDYINFRDDLIKCKCLLWNKTCKKKFNQKLKKRFFNTYKFSNHDNNHFMLMLRKGVCPYSYLNMEDIAGADCSAQEEFHKISWFVRQKRCVIVTWCIWDL